MDAKIGGKRIELRYRVAELEMKPRRFSHVVLALLGLAQLILWGSTGKKHLDDAVFSDSIDEAVVYAHNHLDESDWPKHVYYVEGRAGTLERSTLDRVAEHVATLGASLAPLPGTPLPQPCDCLIRGATPTFNTPLLGITDVFAGSMEGFKEVRLFVLGKWIRLFRYDNRELF